MPKPLKRGVVTGGLMTLAVLTVGWLGGAIYPPVAVADPPVPQPAAIRVVTDHDDAQDKKIEALHEGLAAHIAAPAVNWAVVVSLSTFLLLQFTIFVWRFSTISADVRQNGIDIQKLHAQVDAINTVGPQRANSEIAATLRKIADTVDAHPPRLIAAQVDKLATELDVVRSEVQKINVAGPMRPSQEGLTLFNQFKDRVEDMHRALETEVREMIDEVREEQQLVREHIASCPVPTSGRDPMARTRMTDERKR